MPLLMCPNDDAGMQTLERNGVQFDMCPACRGVWLDRGELEKLMSAAVEEGRAAAQSAPAPAPQAYAPQGQPWGQSALYRDERHRDGDYRHKKKKRDSIFDIFD